MGVIDIKRLPFHVPSFLLVKRYVVSHYEYKRLSQTLSRFHASTFSFDITGLTMIQIAHDSLPLQVDDKEEQQRPTKSNL